MDLNKILVGALQQCDTKDLVEDTFNRFSTSDYHQKAEHLIGAMGSPEVFFSRSNISCKDRYITVLSMFLTGDWKLNQLYDRMGF